MKDREKTVRYILNFIWVISLVCSLVLFGINWHRTSIHGSERSISRDPANPYYMDPIVKEKFLASQHILNESAALLMCLAIVIRLIQEIIKKCSYETNVPSNNKHDGGYDKR